MPVEIKFITFQVPSERLVYLNGSFTGSELRRVFKQREKITNAINPSINLEALPSFREYLKLLDSSVKIARERRGLWIVDKLSEFNMSIDDVSTARLIDDSGEAQVEILTTRGNRAVLEKKNPRSK